MELFALSTCQVGDHMIAYLESGEGETILLIHGITAYFFLWRNIIPLLDKQYKGDRCGSSGLWWFQQRSYGPIFT